MKRLAAALVAVLALSACAVTGQPANPGTAATLDGLTVTSDQVADWAVALGEMGFEPDAVDAGALLSLRLLAPAFEAEAAREGIVVSDTQITTDVASWMSLSGVKGLEPTPDMLDLVRTVRVFYALLSSQDGTSAIADALMKVEDRSRVSPLYGGFSSQRFVESLRQQAQIEQDTAAALGEVSYLAFKDVSGFAPSSDREWMIEPGVDSAASPAASPAVSPAVSPTPTPAP